MFPIRTISKKEADSFLRKAEASPTIGIGVFDVKRVGSIGPPFNARGWFLETTDGELYRLPDDLAEWGFHLVALAVSGGPKLFPSKVSFSVNKYGKSCVDFV